jgi:four helix bundle protein
MKTFRTLDLAVEFHELVRQADLKDKYMTDQLVRASASIALNLSEGNAKGSIKDKKRFFQMAYGSLRECQTVFKLIKCNDPILHKVADQLGACLYRLLKSEIKEFR